MLDILIRSNYRIVHLTDGELLPEAVVLIEDGKADGINLNYVRNWRTDLEPLRNIQSIKCLIVNDYPPSIQFDYSAIFSLINLEHLSISTTDKNEINFSVFPLLKSVSLTWRKKAKSLFKCIQLESLVLNRYTGSDLSELSQLINLKFLRINLGSVVSLNGISELTGLEELMLMQVTKLEDIEDLLKLKHLDCLTLDNCKRIKNIRAVKEMKVRKLIIAGTTPKD
jgi:hypothetical protein